MLAEYGTTVASARLTRLISIIQASAGSINSKVSRLIFTIAPMRLKNTSLNTAQREPGSLFGVKSGRLSLPIVSL